MKINRHVRRRIKKAIRGKRELIAKFMWVNGNEDVGEEVQIFRRHQQPYRDYRTHGTVREPTLTLSASAVLEAWENGGSDRLLQLIDASLALVTS